VGRRIPAQRGAARDQAGIGAGLVQRRHEVDRRGAAADHVIAATGYRVDLRALAFLEAGLRARVSTIEGAPALSPDFESSVSGLHFVGVAAANTFGPVMRFLLGARYASRRITRHVTNGSAV
jgi:hypothetical protein